MSAELDNPDIVGAAIALLANSLHPQEYDRTKSALGIVHTQGQTILKLQREIKRLKISKGDYGHCEHPENKKLNNWCKNCGSLYSDGHWHTPEHKYG